MSIPFFDASVDVVVVVVAVVVVVIGIVEVVSICCRVVDGSE